MKTLLKAAAALGVIVGLLFGGVAALGEATARQMPDLTNVNLGDAEDYYSGIIFNESDNAGNRSVWNEHN